jgi:hypothetical protein
MNSFPPNYFIHAPNVLLLVAYSVRWLAQCPNVPQRVGLPWRSAETVARYDRPAGMRAALSPETGEKAVADQGDVGWPFGMLREYSLLGVDAINERRPTDQYQEERDGIPFL